LWICENIWGILPICFGDWTPARKEEGASSLGNTIGGIEVRRCDAVVSASESDASAEDALMGKSIVGNSQSPARRPKIQVIQPTHSRNGDNTIPVSGRLVISQYSFPPVLVHLMAHTTLISTRAFFFSIFMGNRVTERLVVGRGLQIPHISSISATEGFIVAVGLEIW
jgi:hypothetical protein